MFIRIAIGALPVPAPIGLPAGAHSLFVLPNAFDVSERDPVSALAESHTDALTFDVGE